MPKSIIIGGTKTKSTYSMKPILRTLCFALGLFGVFTLPAEAKVIVSSSMALHGTPRYPEGFTHFDYVNPDAPKGGDIRLSAFGTFDSLNPFIPKGNAADGIDAIYETLAAKSYDEAFSLYGLIAQSFEYDPDDNRWIIFHLNPQAHFSDGVPITADDVAFSFDTLIKKGEPAYKVMFADVEGVAVLDSHRIRFNFRTPDNRELPLILAAQLPILPKHYWQHHDFSKSGLDIPIGSGPYVVESLDPGHTITYRLDPHYWGASLPARRGSNNFERMTYRYYRDAVVAMEAFKGGQYDLRMENKAKNWAKLYRFPAVTDGWVKKQEIPNQNPAGMQGYLFNLRKSLFQDIRVREALAQTFDFEWSNRFLFFNAYHRSTSFFANSELAASAGTPTPDELALLTPYRHQLPSTVFTGVRIPASDGHGHNRPNLMFAQELLRQAGWHIQDNQLVNAIGEPFKFEILNAQPEMERIIQPMLRNMEKLGIQVTIRNVDTSQYIERLRKFDFDMIIHTYAESLSPGNEQRNFWGSAAATHPGSLNLIGIQNPVVDAMIDKIISARRREDLITATHALDRVLLANWYVIPQYHTNSYRVATWDIFKRPALSPKYTLGEDTWWIDPLKLQQIRAHQGGQAQ